MAALLSATGVPISGPVRGADLARVRLFDGRCGELLNTWGGGWKAAGAQAVELRAKYGLAGDEALAIELGPTEAHQPRAVRCFACGTGCDSPYQQTRDLARYRKIEFDVENATAAAVRGLLRVKDYRNTEQHAASYHFEVKAAAGWTHVVASIPPTGPGWTVGGVPDLTRVLVLEFVFEPRQRISGGRVYLDDLVVVEPDGPIDATSMPLAALVQRVAHRQWDALWAARSRAHGMIPNTSYSAADAGVNATAAVLWMLPAAVRRQWVEQDEADRYVALLVRTIDSLLDRAKYLPPRNVDWVTLDASLLPEESSVDAAFLAVALHQYKSLPSTPPELRRAIDRAQNRFDFAPFVSRSGWRMAYRYASAHGAVGFAPLTYDGYTNESNMVSLAAHLQTRHHVPIETCWHTNVNRTRVNLVRLGKDPVVHSHHEFRAPFAQALWNLFVDVRQRGVDRYPESRLAVNPWRNFVCYEQAVMIRLRELGRPYFVQPDAGDDGTLGNYRQFSLYEQFGQRDLFMPWSAAFALLAGADGGEDAIRFLLAHDLADTFGLADSAHWKTGALRPHSLTPRHDFWNTGLSTMALLEWLDGSQRLSKSFAELPDVRAALDRVFSPSDNQARRRIDFADLFR